MEEKVFQQHGQNELIFIFRWPEYSRLRRKENLEKMFSYGKWPSEHVCVRVYVYDCVCRTISVWNLFSEQLTLTSDIHTIHCDWSVHID